MSDERKCLDCKRMTADYYLVGNKSVRCSKCYERRLSTARLKANTSPIRQVKRHYPDDYVHCPNSFDNTVRLIEEKSC